MPKKHHGPRVVEKAKDFKGTLKKFIKSLKEYKFKIIIIIIFAFLSTIFAIVGPKLLGNATTLLFDGFVSKISGGLGIDFGSIGKILIILLMLYVISAIFSYVQGIIMTSVSQNYTYKLRNKVINKINKLPFKYFDKKTSGDVLSIITNDIDTIGQSLNQSAIELITSTTTIIGVLVMMVSISVTMTLITVTILPLSIIVTSFIVSKSQKHFKNQQNYLAEVNSEVEEILSGYHIIKAFNREEQMLSKFENDNLKLRDSVRKSQFISGLMMPIMNFLSNIGYVLVAVFGTYFAVKGKITVGNIQSFISYSKNFTRPISSFAQVLNILQSMIAASERVFEFLEEPEEKLEKGKKLKNIKGTVEFKNVRFGYNEDKIVINNFNALIKPGQKVAIVGPTGAGKTTIVKLLMRFYELNSGEILIDGKNILNYSKKELRKSIGMVLQDAFLFSGSIMDNLRYGNLEASDDEVIRAAKKAYVHRIIKTLPNGYDMIINEETSNISIGQKQLITIARAILSNPKILILDEATSSVDTRTEILIQKAMKELMKNKTSFIIAHRLSTIKDADVIMVMYDGDIVEIGNHHSLLQNNSYYSKLYNSQFEEV